VREPISSTEPDLSLRVIAEHTIAVLTEPTEIVVDLGCGTGAILIEAIRTNRMAIGIERSPHLAASARNRIDRATRNGGPGFATVVVGDPLDAPLLVGADTVGQVSLVVAELTDVSESIDDTLADLDAQIKDVLAVASTLLAPGGHAVITTWFRRRSTQSLTALWHESEDRGTFVLAEQGTAQSLTGCLPHCRFRQDVAIFRRGGTAT
jgi:SAM-dependent methyltransferase